MTMSAFKQEAAPVALSTNEKAPISAWYALAVLIMSTVLGGVDKLILNLQLEPIRISLSLTDTQIGLLQGAGLALFAGLATLPLGWLSDRYDRRVVLAACVVLWSAATGLRGTAETYGVLFIASIGLGVGEAGLTPITNSLIPDLFSRAQRVLANTVYALSTIFGAALGSILAGSIVKMMDDMRPVLPVSMQTLESWRLTFFFMGLVGIPAALLVLSIRSTQRTSKAEQAVLAVAKVGPDENLVTFREHMIAHWRTFIGLIVGTGLAGIGLSSLGGWIPVLAVRSFGSTPAEVGQGIGIAILCGTIVGGAVGFFAVRHAQRVVGPAAAVRVVMVGNVIAALLSTLLLFVTTSTQAFMLLGLLVMPLIGGAVAVPNVLQDAAPPHLRSRTIAVLTILGLPFGVIGPLMVGVLSDAFKHLDNGLAIAIVCTTVVGGLVGAVVLYVTERPFVRLMREAHIT